MGDVLKIRDFVGSNLGSSGSEVLWGIRQPDSLENIMCCVQRPFWEPESHAVLSLEAKNDWMGARWKSLRRTQLWFMCNGYLAESRFSKNNHRILRSSPSRFIFRPGFEGDGGQLKAQQCAATYVSKQLEHQGCIYLFVFGCNVCWKILLQSALDHLDYNWTFLQRVSETSSHL